MTKVVIGLVAHASGGKETFGTILKEWAGENGFTVEIISTGSGGLLGKVGDDLRGTGFQKNTANLIILSNAIRVHLGKDTLARGAGLLVARSAAEIVVYDSIRWDTDMQVVQGFKDHMTIFVTADAETRYQRLKDRARDGEAVMSWMEFLKREQDPTAVEIQRLGEMADFKIANKLGLEEYRKSVRNFLQSYVKLILERGNPSRGIL